MISTLIQLASRTLGKHFLAMESLRYIPDELVEMIFDEYLKTISSLSIINECDFTRIVKILTDYHSEKFCTSFCYHLTNHLNILSAKFYHYLFKSIEFNLIQLDFSNAFDKYNDEEKETFLNIIGQMENIEYLRLTHNRFDDDDIRLLTASHRIQSRSLCSLHTLHLQGNNLTGRSARFLKSLTSLDTLYISLCSTQEKSIFVKEFDNLHECTCSIQHGWEEIINRGWIAKIPQLQISTVTDDTHFYRKRRRVDNDDTLFLIKLVRLCATCQPKSLPKQTKKFKEIVSNPTSFIDSAEANDLLSCYL